MCNRNFIGIPKISQYGNKRIWMLPEVNTKSASLVPGFGGNFDHGGG